MSAELDAVEERIEKGVAWLTEHDPTGAFHFWFESGISPHSTMPRATDKQKEGYRQYHKQRLLFKALWEQMERLEAIERQRAKETA